VGEYKSCFPSPVTRSLKKLKEINLIAKVAGGYTTVEDWQTSLKNYQLDSGSDERSNRIQNSTRTETINFQKKLKPGIKRSSEMNWRFYELTLI